MNRSNIVIFLILVVVPWLTYSSAEPRTDSDLERVYLNLGFSPAYRLPMAVEEHDNDPGVIVPAEYLRQVELAASKNPAFVRLYRIASQAGDEIGHVMLEQQQVKRTVHALQAQLSDASRSHFYCMTGCAAMICGFICWTQYKK